MAELTKEYFDKALKAQSKDLKGYTDKKIEGLALMIQNNVAMKDDLKNMTTKTDVAELRLEMNERLDDVAHKDDIRDLETKLVEDTSTVTGVEQKHYDSITQRVVRLEKAVFDKKVAS